ncbi:1-aminocyclopropane-1-carboxylate oxidase-like isoform X2 [Camellia sinensis]|uniref:1-aminocyclopropane-1-carboxylate oxidase-like isoform X2 n=1 Tax=Camellia sinensis TaxID=4442 RepID=UPI001036688F|nr:1-aminocyclopropane-1-carboxylate oxidase-like isoform X2 [Camellia sinensis]
MASPEKTMTLPETRQTTAAPPEMGMRWRILFPGRRPVGKERKGKKMAKALQLPIIDLASLDRISTANSIRQACIECGFFYLINHGVEQELLKQVFDESKRFFSLPLEEKMKLLHRENRGYTPLYAENLNPSSSSKGELGLSDEEIFGASAHSDYGMITLLATDGVGGLQVCRDKSKQPLVWEDVDHINGALIVNIGGMTERWTNCLFRSTLHRVMSTGRERYSMAFFLNPSADCVVECLESCCSELTPPRYGHPLGLTSVIIRHCSLCLKLEVSGFGIAFC